MSKQITVSLVSHGHLHTIGHLIQRLINDDLVKTVILTINDPRLEQNLLEYRDKKIKVIVNNCPKGFGLNHNLAFFSSDSETDYFLVINPDIDLALVDFQALVDFLDEDERVAVISPVHVDSNLKPLLFARRFLRLEAGALRDFMLSKVNYFSRVNGLCETEWIPGAFMLFRSTDYRKVNGFDSKTYYMYVEDMDICRRLSALPSKIAILETQRLIHDAARYSRRKLKFLYMHVTSLANYIYKDMKGTFLK